MINASNISKSFSDRVLFKNLTLNIQGKDRIALVGANGSGKTTLMDILAGNSMADSGSITINKGSSIGYLRQEFTRSTNNTLLQEILAASPGISDLTNLIEQTRSSISLTSNLDKQNSLLKKLGQLEAELDVEESLHKKHEAESILSGLGFKDQDFMRNINEFSGGWAMRAELAKLLYGKPSVLLLDEPTNHLDLHANLWFEKYLHSFQGAVLITSHDREFLNQTVNMVLAIEPEEVILVNGNYDRFLDFRQQLMENREASHARQLKQVQKQMQFVDRFRAKATKASQVQSRLKQLKKLETIEMPRVTKKVNYSFPEPPRSGSEVISLENISKSYGSTYVYHNLNLSITRGEKIALVGPNGAGKSTLLKILAAILPFENGERKIGFNVKTAYYAQHLLDLLNPKRTILEELQGVANGESEQYLRQVLGGFLFTANEVFKKIEILSGGEKARIALAKLLIQPSNLLLMDEPTNHLDIVSREILADALNSYKGTICLITHDRSLMSQVSNKIIEIENGDLNQFIGGYESYVYHRDKQKTETSQISIHQTGKPMNTDKSLSLTSGNRQSRKPSNLEKLDNKTLLKESKQLSTRMRVIDNLISKNEKEISLLETMFANPAGFEHPQQLTSAGKRYQDLQEDTGVLWEEWQNLAIQLDKIEPRHNT